MKHNRYQRKLSSRSIIHVLEPRTLFSVSLLKDINPGTGDAGPSQGVYLNGQYIFTANDGADGWQLWSSDGSTAGTAMLFNVSPNRISSSSFAQLTRIGNEAYFAAVSSAGKSEIWKTDGTANGTFLIDTLSAGYSLSGFVGAGSNVFFSVSQSLGAPQWVTDGTAAGTFSLGVAGNQYVSPVVLGNNVLFRSDNAATSAHELWISDGTVAGTSKLASFGSNGLLSIAVINGEAYFDGYDSIHGTELWKSDGTVTGTMLVDDLAPGTASSAPGNLTVVNSKIFFDAIPSGGYEQLWKTDGTSGGTVQLSNIASAAHSGVFLQSLLPFGNKIIFQNVGDLYVSDGTTTGTIELTTGSQPNGRSSAEIFPNSIVVSGPYVYFNQNGAAGYELSRTDGTVEGTAQIDDINANPVGAYPVGSSSPSGFVAGPPGVAMFFANDGLHGVEPYLAVPDTIIPARSVLTVNKSSSPQVLVTGVLSIAGSIGNWSGKLDITNNDIDIITGSLATINNQISTGFTAGTWQGEGITSSTAAADSAKMTAIGIIQNNESGAALFNVTNTFDGIVPGSSDILAKYTYYGDANLDGKVDGSDYSRIDSGYLTRASGWYNGDFNYDGDVNASDYTLIDNAFNRQGAPLAAQVTTIKPTPAAYCSLKNLSTTDQTSQSAWYETGDSQERKRFSRRTFSLIHGL